jgi:curved DNA-binding protein CbpA
MRIDPSKDFYAILQANPGDGQAAIKAAYRRLVRVRHPDLAPSLGASRRMQDIDAAYEVLSDPILRSRYDLLRASFYSSPPPTVPDAAAPRGPSDDAHASSPPGPAARTAAPPGRAAGDRIRRWMKRLRPVLG